MDEKILHFPDRSLLKLINDIDSLLRGDIGPDTVLEQCDVAMQAIGAVRDANGDWTLPDSAEGKS